jgi:hypothetical protein
MGIDWAHAAPASLDLILAGIGLVFVGLVFRFAPRVDRHSRWYYPGLLLAILFGATPRSWVPWGLTVLFFGLSLAAQGPIVPLFLFVSTVCLTIGILLVSYAPQWLEPRSMSSTNDSPSEG